MKMQINLCFAFQSLVTLLVFLTFPLSAQQTVRYDLFVRDTIVNFSGKQKNAIAVNGQIPMPTLTFFQGDTAEIHVHNEMRKGTSLHWHGLFLPNKEDGVPYLTQMPIPSHSTHIYRFPIVQNGTHWYHSHSGFQEQIGMYGSMTLQKRESDFSFRLGIDDLPTISLMLSEWTDLNPKTVHRMLHNASDWFGIKKGSTQSYLEAIAAGHLGTKLTNEWKRQRSMDVSDVYYDAFLVNGARTQSYPEFKNGDRIRLRVANGGASTYFWTTYAGGKITVVANDGNDLQPTEVDRLIIAVSETYDIIVTVPEDAKAFELLFTAEDRTGDASVFLGSGEKKMAQRLPRLDYFAGMRMMNVMMKMDGSMDDMGMKMSLQKMDMNSVMYPEVTGNFQKSDPHATHQAPVSPISTLDYSMMKAQSPTRIDSTSPTKELRFELTGNMNRYLWSIDNRVLSESDKILIQKGTVLRIVLYNGSMMRHPMHIHGHDFRVVNGQGEYAPMKNVLDIMPMETDTIEFLANSEGDWFFHCHILYHMMSGMNRVFSYEQQDTNPLLPNRKSAYKKLQRESNTIHVMAVNDFAFNGNDGMAQLQNARWQFGTEWRLGYNSMHGFETETRLGRYLGKMQWSALFIGFDWQYRKMKTGEIDRNIFGQENGTENRARASLEFQYTLPMFLAFQVKAQHDGNVRLQLSRDDIPISRRLRTGFMVNTDYEYMVDLRCILTRNISLRGHYDSNMGPGVGLTLSY